MATVTATSQFADERARAAGFAFGSFRTVANRVKRADGRADLLQETGGETGKQSNWHGWGMGPWQQSEEAEKEQDPFAAATAAAVSNLQIIRVCFSDHRRNREPHGN